MSTNENKTINVSELKEVVEEINNSISLLMLLETDLSMERSDEVYYRSVKIIHNMLLDANSKLAESIQGFNE